MAIEENKTTKKKMIGRRMTAEEIQAFIEGAGNIEVMKHPVVAHKISRLRDKTTGTKECRELAKEIAYLMLYEATRNVPTELVEVETPVATTSSPALAGKKPVAVEVLRAGKYMVAGAEAFMPSIKTGTIGEYRGDDLKPVPYYCKLPTDSAERRLYVVDPMLATGGSGAAAVTTIQETYHVPDAQITFMSIFAAPEGIVYFHEQHPHVRLLLGVVDEYLTEDGWIYPGMGDAGDRLSGTP